MKTNEITKNNAQAQTIGTASAVNNEAVSIIQNLTGEITGEQLLNEPVKERDWLLEHLIPRTGMGSLIGGSDIGKSALLRQGAIQLCAGDKKFLDFNLMPIHRSALVCCSEDDEEAVKYLLHKQAEKYKPAQLARLRFLFCSSVENLLLELDKRLTAAPADLVIIDCFADVFFGDLKDTTQLRQFLNEYLKLIDKHKCYFLFLHHTGKRTENLEPSKNNALSGQGFEAKVRLVMELRKDQMSPMTRHLCIVKGNYISHKMKAESFVLNFSETDLNFTNTGERTPFELLIKSADDAGKAKYEQAKDLKEKGYSYEKIAEALGYKNKASVSQLFDRAKKNGWDK
jgi:RecA-family ATPase